MGTLIILEAANLYVGDDGPNNSKHLNLMNVKFPVMEEKTAEHHPGGSIGAIDIGGLGFGALSVPFKLTGIDPQAMVQFGIGSANPKPYTIYGLARDKNGNKPIEVKAVVKGRMSKIEIADFKRGELTDQDHEIKEIMHYEFYYNKQEVYYYDFLSSQWRVGGVDQKADENAILRIA